MLPREKLKIHIAFLRRFVQNFKYLRDQRWKTASTHSGFVWFSFVFLKTVELIFIYSSLKFLGVKCVVMPLCLTAWTDGTAWVGWIGLVHGDKPWLCAGRWRWRWTHLGLARHSLCGLLTNAVLTLVLKPLIKLKEKTRMVTSVGESKVRVEGNMYKNVLITSRGTPSGSRHPDGK